MKPAPPVIKTRMKIHPGRFEPMLDIPRPARTPSPSVAPKLPVPNRGIFGSPHGRSLLDRRSPIADFLGALRWDVCLSASTLQDNAIGDEQSFPGSIV